MSKTTVKVSKDTLLFSGLHYANLEFNELLEDHIHFKLITVKDRTSDQFYLVKTIDPKTPAQAEKIKAEIEILEKLRGKQIVPIVFFKYCGYFKLENLISGSEEYNFVFENFNGVSLTKSLGGNMKLSMREINNFYDTIVNGLAFLQSLDIFLPGISLEMFYISKNPDAFQIKMLISLMSESGSDFENISNLQKSLISFGYLLKKLLNESSEEEEEEKNEKSLRIKKTVEKLIDEKKEKPDFLKLFRKKLDLKKNMAEYLRIEEINFVKKQATQKKFELTGNDNNIKIYGMGSEKIVEFFKTEQEAVNILDHIKTIATFNVEIKKLDPKKENLRLLPKIVDRIQDFVEIFVLQTSPCEKLTGNDTFLKYLYENFYKLEPLEGQHVLRYVQEHDNNWFSGVSVQMMETLLGVIGNFSSKFEEFQVLRVFLASWNILNNAMVSTLAQQLSQIMPNLKVLELGIEGANVTEESTVPVIRALKSAVKVASLEKLSFFISTTKGHDEVLGHVGKIIKSQKKITSFGIFVKEVTRSIKVAKFVKHFNEAFLSNLEVLKIGFVSYAANPLLEEESIEKILVLLTGENLKKLRHFFLCICSKNSVFTKTCNILLDLTHEKAFESFTLYISGLIKLYFVFS